MVNEKTKKGGISVNRKSVKEAFCQRFPEKEIKE